MSRAAEPLHGRRMFWIAVAAPPLVWFANLSVSYGLAVRSCATGRVWPIYVSTFVSVLLVGAALAFAIREWRRLGKPRRALDPGAEGASEFLAAGARLLSAFFFIVIIMATLPVLLYSSCRG